MTTAYKDPFDGFTVEVFQEDGEWIGRLAEHPTTTTVADAEEEVLSLLQEAWELTKETYVADGKKVPVAPRRKRYSGQLIARLKPSTHKELAIWAAKENVSVNTLLNDFIERGLGIAQEREQLLTCFAESLQKKHTTKKRPTRSVKKIKSSR